MHNFRTYQLAKTFYKKAMKLEFKGEVRSQFQRATLSIVLNLAEGSGKITPKDKRRFYAIALGSLNESRAILDLYDKHQLFQESEKLLAHLLNLIKNPGF